MTVKFNNSLSQAQYEALPTKDMGTLYFTLDTKRIYKGNDLYSLTSKVDDVQYNSTSKVLTITYVNGTTGQIDLGAELADKINIKPNGTDPLIDSNGKITSAYLPDSLMGQMTLCGTFDAATGNIVNDLRSPAGRPWQLGDYLINLTIGHKLPETQDEIAETINVGDWIWYDGTSWGIIPNTDAVSSVNGKTGNVVLNKNDIGLSNVDNIQQASKTEFNTHNSDNVRHITAQERLKWDANTSVTVENILTSTSTVNALSAAMGKALNDRLVTAENALTWQ